APPFVPADLIELTSELFCFLGVKGYIRPCHVIKPDGIGIIKLGNNHSVVVIRDSADMTGRLVVVEPCRVVFVDLDINRFQAAFLRVINGHFHLIFIFDLHL
ncbi:MAG TPA: hypothetical protein PKX47_10400, partial [Smithellaceae bacterium]|nr:hypothetical protein [Smithellaceae bacterium]HPI52635.1 hypothetical protein [Smithellaceae bacterium]